MPTRYVDQPKHSKLFVYIHKPLLIVLKHQHNLAKFRINETNILKYQQKKFPKLNDSREI